MPVTRFFAHSCRWLGVPAFAGLAACTQPADADGHRITKAQLVNGKYVNTVAPTDKDLEETRRQAAEMKKTAGDTTFTPAEQQAGK